MLRNLSQLLSEFDEFIATYFLEVRNFNDGNSDFSFQKKIEKLNILLSQIAELAPDFLTQKLENHFINKEYEQLFKLAEFLRLIGINEEIPVLWNNRNENLTMLLKISHLLFEYKTVDITQNAYYLFFVKTVFDITFHQVWFSEYEPTIKLAYFKLCNEILDEKYHYLLKEDIYRHYDAIIYFIELNDGKFDKEELIKLLPKIQKITANGGFSHEWIENIEERLLQQ